METLFKKENDLISQRHMKSRRQECQNSLIYVTGTKGKCTSCRDVTYAALVFFITLYASAAILGVSAAGEAPSSPHPQGDNSTQADTVLSLNLTSETGFSHPGYSMPDQAGGRNRSDGRVKIMSQGVGAVPDEQVLMEKLMIGYHRYSRPVVNASYTVTVKFGLTLVQISDMDEVNQVLTINVWLEQEWDDERLTWDPKDYNNLQMLRIPCEKLWLPDIVLYNSADDYTTGYMNSKAMVHYTGNVFWPPPAKFRSSCKIDITYFPFDDQTCELKFGSWTYDGFQVDITNRSATVDLDNYVFSGEWELIDVRIKRMEITYACCIEPYPDVRFTIVIRRKTLYYLFNIIFPCLWLTILSLLGFWLPPDSGEKITLGITVLLAFSVFMLLIAESMPATSEFVPLIGIYLTVTMGMTSLSIILTVFVLQLHHVGPHKRPVPGWLRTLICDVLARLVCMSRESQPFSKRYQHHHQLRQCYAGAGEGGHRGNGRPSRHTPRVVVEPSAAGTATQLSRNDSGRGRVYSFNPPNDSGGSDVEDGNGSSTTVKGDGNRLRVSVPNDFPTYSYGSDSKLRSVKIPQAPHGNVTITPPPPCCQVSGSTGGSSSSTSRRGNNCNGDIFLHQREGLSPASINELAPPGLESSRFSDEGLQCREYCFHEPFSYTHGHEQMSAGFTRTVSRSPSFRTRTGSFREDRYRASFRPGFTVVSSHPSQEGFPDVSSAAGGGGAYPVSYGAYTDPAFDSYQQLVMEWQFIAHVMDRLLFWLFLFVALISSVAILVIKPMFKPPV